MKLYVQSIETGMSAREAKALAASSRPAYAVPQDRSDWMVIFLGSVRKSPGQLHFRTEHPGALFFPTDRPVRTSRGSGDSPHYMQVYQEVY